MIVLTPAGRDALLREYVRRHGVARERGDDHSRRILSARAAEIGDAAGCSVALEADEYSIATAADAAAGNRTPATNFDAQTWQRSA